MRIQLLDALAEQLTQPGIQPATGRAVTRLIRGLRNHGPSAFKVAQAATLTGKNTEFFLGDTAEAVDLRRSPACYVARSHTLAAQHILDVSTVAQLDDKALANAVKGLDVRAVVTEGAVNQVISGGKVPLQRIQDLAVVERINDIKRIRQIMMIRTQLMREYPSEESRPEAMCLLADAETIGLSLRYAEHDRPARVVTHSPRAIARYQRFGLVGTTIWAILADAVAEGRLSKAAAGPLRLVRSRHDPYYDSRRTAWPMAAEPLSRDDGSSPRLR